ncbi:MAG: hypothetical protein V7L22_30040 [Nostoc sp.]|uniref:hypothetical protein n=1 Tax=Nostoc sp. TaxID=1180 RepID=UPI002FFBEC08
MKIDGYPEITSVASTDLLLVETSSDGAYKKVQKSNLLAGLSSGGSSLQFIQLADKRSSGIPGGNFAANVWKERTVNTIAHDDTASVTLSSNTFVLPPGSYWIDAKAYFYLSNYSQMRLYNTTDNTVLALGITAWNTVSNGGYLNHVSGYFTVASGKNLQLQYHVSASNLQSANTGDAAGNGNDEIYALIDIFKVG